VSTMEQAVDKMLAMDRFTKWLLGLLGATGLVLAIVGVYGVIAYFVTQRTHELGVRLALGASVSGLRWLVVRQGMVLAGMGVAFGAMVSLAVSRCCSASRRAIRSRSPSSAPCSRSWLSARAICRRVVRRGSIRWRR
jgi:putative ABC transport system permease protein